MALTYIIVADIYQPGAVAAQTTTSTSNGSAPIIEIVGSGLSGWSGYSGYSGFSGGSGTSGYSGFFGSNGATGASGFSGYSGLGTSGFSGASGASGASGSAGATGASGFSGYSGLGGTNGTNGATGASGFSGKSGYSGTFGGLTVQYELAVGIPTGDFGAAGPGAFALFHDPSLITEIYTPATAGAVAFEVKDMNGNTNTALISTFNGIVTLYDPANPLNFSSWAISNPTLISATYTSYYFAATFLAGNITTLNESGYTYDFSFSPQGSSGYSGFSGLSGVNGTTGATGTSGFSGYSGTNGSTGAVGTSGYSGYSGTNGSAGATGTSGYSGTNGSAGATGTSGFSGYSGTTGFMGTSGYSGFSGVSGYSGKSGYSGTNGIAGQSGYSGYSGSNGSTGSTGTSGFSGYSGTTGFMGTSGFSGFSGVSGYSGKSGYSGTNGIAGQSGYSGYSGSNGSTGSTGTSGFSGYSGFSGAGVTSAQIQAETYVYFSDTGTANAYAITASPAIASYVAGQRFVFNPAHNNTAASTLNVNGLGVKQIRRYNVVGLNANQIIAGNPADVVYNGTYFVLMSNGVLPAQQYMINDSGVADAYVGAFTPTLSAGIAGMQMILNAVLNTNTGSSGGATLDAGFGAFPIYQYVAGVQTYPNAKAIPAGSTMVFIYSTSQSGWQMMNPCA
jgi:hypothetical protein